MSHTYCDCGGTVTVAYRHDTLVIRKGREEWVPLPLSEKSETWTCHGCGGKAERHWSQGRPVVTVLREGQR